MLRNGLAFCAALVLAAGIAGADEKKDSDTKVAEGTEVELTPADVKADDPPLDDGRSVAVTKAGKATKVKMPATAYTLGFTGEAVKDGGIKITSLSEPTALVGMRVGAGQEEGSWMCDPGDVITHANGYAVNTFEELLAAVSLAKKPEDVQLVVKDINTGKATIFYVTAQKR
jgi:hypothetical protein